MTMVLSKTVFELLCKNAEAGQSINLARAGLHATFQQAITLVGLMRLRGALYVRNEGYDVDEIAELRRSGCKWVSDRPETPPPDDQPVW